MADKKKKTTKATKGTPGNLRARELEIKAIEYRKAGVTYDQIGQALGVSGNGAWKAVQRGLKRLTEECAEKAKEVRHLETLRLDRLWQGVYEDAMRGDTSAINTALRIMERRARLWNLDMIEADEMMTEKKEIVFKLLKEIGNSDAG